MPTQRRARELGGGVAEGARPAWEFVRVGGAVPDCPWGRQALGAR